jgi:hypothetical protein
MHGSYDRLGIHFLYPENWNIVDEEAASSPRTVSVQSPEGGFWSVMLYGPQHDPEQLTRQVLSTMQAEYEDVEVSPVEASFEGIRAAGYDMLFYCLDFVVNSRTLATRTGDSTILMIWQAEDRDFRRLEPVFQAITTSLLRQRQAIV